MKRQVLCLLLILVFTLSLGLTEGYADGWKGGEPDTTPKPGIAPTTAPTTEPWTTPRPDPPSPTDEPMDPCEAYGHEWTESYYIQGPTCTEPGLIEHRCSRCGASVLEETPPYGHNFVDGVCTRCGAKENGETEEDPCKEGHNFVDGVCTRCGAKENEGTDEGTNTGSPTPTTPKPAPVFPDNGKDKDNNQKVEGTGRNLVITGPIESVTITDRQGNTVFELKADKSISTSALTRDFVISENSNGTVIQLVIPLPDGETEYQASITVRGDSGEKSQSLGISLYQFDEDKNMTAMVALKDGLVTKPEDGAIKVQIKSGVSKDSLLVTTGEMAGESDPLATNALSLEDEMMAYPVSVKVEAAGQPPVSQENSGGFRRYGEVTYLRAPVEEGYTFTGWYLEGKDEPLTTDPELYYFVTGSTVLIARYDTAQAETGAAAGGSSARQDGGSVLVPVLLALVGLGCAGGALALILSRKKQQVEGEIPLRREATTTVSDGMPIIPPLQEMPDLYPNAPSVQPVQPDRRESEVTTQNRL